MQGAAPRPWRMAVAALAEIRPPCPPELRLSWAGSSGSDPRRPEALPSEGRCYGTKGSALRESLRS